MHLFVAVVLSFFFLCHENAFFWRNGFIVSFLCHEKCIFVSQWSFYYYRAKVAGLCLSILFCSISMSKQQEIYHPYESLGSLSGSLPGFLVKAWYRRGLVKCDMSDYAGAVIDMEKALAGETTSGGRLQIKRELAQMEMKLMSVHGSKTKQINSLSSKFSTKGAGTEWWLG